MSSEGKGYALKYFHLTETKRKALDNLPLNSGSVIQKTLNFLCTRTPLVRKNEIGELYYLGNEVE